MKHTPGPWMFYRDDGCNHIKSADGKLSLCDTSYYPWINANEADWQLIATAPELLAACEVALSTLEAYQRVLAAAGNQPFAVPNWLINVLRDALVKAKEKPKGD